MTLRLRLVAGLVLLVTIGLAIFGVSTYAAYSRSQYQRLDDQLRNAVPGVATAVYERIGLVPAGGPGGGRFALPPFGTYAELRDNAGEVLFQGMIGDSVNRPKLPDVIADPGETGRVFTTGSAVGSGDWRVSVTRSRPDGALLIVSIPTREVTDSLRRLILIESSAGGGLLVILAAGSWLIVRRGLRPLEQMANSTRAITAGELSQRVEPSDGRTEVGQLGLALNTMLGEIEGAFKARDATEQRLRQFLADASHELRTPLTSIQGFAELFRLGADHPDLDLPVVMRRIEQESARMRRLVDDLILLARLDEPRPVERTSVDLTVLAADACSDAHAIAPERPVTLDAPEPVVVHGDRDHLRQAIANLVTNAVSHTPSGTAVVVSTRFEDHEAVVCVRDHGQGLDAEALAHVFDRFWQADSARVGSGSGLGLAIVEGIAHEHGGTVTAANAPDGGAVFTLRLPVAGAVAPGRRTSDSERTPSLDGGTPQPVTG